MFFKILGEEKNKIQDKKIMVCLGFKTVYNIECLLENVSMWASD